VITTAVDLEVCAAGKGGANAQNQFTGTGGRDGDILYTEVFLAAKDGGSHGSAWGLAVIDLIWS
jgi:hypothetical protein